GSPTGRSRKSSSTASNSACSAPACAAPTSNRRSATRSPRWCRTISASSARQSTAASRSTRSRPATTCRERSRSFSRRRSPRSARARRREAKASSPSRAKGSISMLGRFTTQRRVAAAEPAPPAAEAPSLQLVQELPKPEPEPAPTSAPLRDKLLDAKVRLHRKLIEDINLSAIEKICEGEVRRQIAGMVTQYVLAERIALNAQELDSFVDEII